MTPVYTWLVEL